MGKEKKNRREVSARRERESETAIKKREPGKPERRQVRVNPTKVAGKRPQAGSLFLTPLKSFIGVYHSTFNCEIATRQGISFRTV